MLPALCRNRPVPAAALEYRLQPRMPVRLFTQTLLFSDLLKQVKVFIEMLGYNTLDISHFIFYKIKLSLVKYCNLALLPPLFSHGFPRRKTLN